MLQKHLKKKYLNITILALFGNVIAIWSQFLKPTLN